MTRWTTCLPVLAAFGALALAGSGSPSLAQQTAADPCASARADLPIIEQTSSVAVVEAFLSSTPPRCAVLVAVAKERLEVLKKNAAWEAEMDKKFAELRAAEEEVAKEKKEEAEILALVYQQSVADAKAIGIVGQWCFKGRPITNIRFDEQGRLCQRGSYGELCEWLSSADRQKDTVNYFSGTYDSPAEARADNTIRHRMEMIGRELKINTGGPYQRC